MIIYTLSLSLSLSLQFECSFEATGLITSLTTCFPIFDLHKIVWCRYQSMHYSYLSPPRLNLVSSNERCSSKAVKAGSSVFKLSKQLLFRCYYHWKLRLLFGRYMICHHSLFKSLFDRTLAPLKMAPALAPLKEQLLWRSWSRFEKRLVKRLLRTGRREPTVRSCAKLVL